MLYSEIIAVCSQFHTKHINTVCGQNVELLNVKLAAHIVTAGLFGKETILATSVMQRISIDRSHRASLFMAAYFKLLITKHLCVILSAGFIHSASQRLRPYQRHQHQRLLSAGNTECYLAASYSCVRAAAQYLYCGK